MQVLADLMGIAAHQGIDRPQQTGADESRGGFIDLDGVLEGDAGIGKHKN